MFKKTLLTAMLLAAASLGLHAASFYVSPTGSSSGDGSLSRPWDLQTALNHPASVRPGDTLWLRGGVHRKNNAPTFFYSYLTGASGLPITVRQYPGERATVDGSIQQSSGRYVTYWGFEIMCSNPNRNATEVWATGGFDLRAPYIKLINLIIHDSFGNGIFVATSATNPEIYGVLSYYNGFQATDRGHGHGIYAQSASPSVTKLQECLFYANYGLGIQAYGTSATVDNMQLEGNAAFCASQISTTSKQLSNLLIGRESGTANNPSVIRNFTYDTRPNGSSDVNMGYAGGTYNLVLRSNYFQTAVQFSSTSGATITGNTFLGGANCSQSSYPNNSYSTARPTSNLVEVRPNKYEAGRAHIIVYNWQNLSSVQADISRALPVGSAFEVRSAWNYFGAPVLSGTYQGGSITLPMTGLTAAKPMGTVAPTPSTPTFNVFVLVPLSGGSSGGSSQPPVISSIANQTTSEDTATQPISFTVSDPDTAATSLTVRATSSNSTLVPAANLVLGGSGSSRTLTITPAANQSGTATITVSATDGAQTVNRSFVLTVNPVNDVPTMSSISSITTAAGSTCAPVPFTVSDVETPAGSLTLMAGSSNPTLLPNANIAFGGSGANRTVTVRHVANQTGTATVTVSLSDGNTTVLRSFTVTVIASTGVVQVEAEAGSLATPMGVVTDTTTARYVRTATANQGSVSLQVNVPVSGTYVVWCRVLAPTYANDSFFVSVDGGAEDVFDVAEGKWANTWQWSRLNGRAGGAPLSLNPRTLNLTQGTHTIVFRGRDINTGLDKIILTRDTQYVPQ